MEEELALARIQLLSKGIWVQKRCRRGAGVSWSLSQPERKQGCKKAGWRMKQLYWRSNTCTMCMRKRLPTSVTSRVGPGLGFDSSYSNKSLGVWWLTLAVELGSI
ncbi:hypothetical protein AAFF_G00357830 [Aldrovandia affinis]|uniref:Uncharacterized protein n=1 Tax=Aldrovandia affinis TaxID=143900 RepID=A0AAD7T8U6_9TELE|nr:hypothetical protein AAFF_G00357830 [Aldrovandia affinis]